MAPVDGVAAVLSAGRENGAVVAVLAPEGVLLVSATSEELGIGEANGSGLSRWLPLDRREAKLTAVTVQQREFGESIAATTWTLEISGESVEFKSRASESGPNSASAFARALALALGWGLPGDNRP